MMTATHCMHGHELTPETLYVSPAGDRICRVCKRIRDKERRIRESWDQGRLSSARPSDRHSAYRPASRWSGTE